MSQSPRSSETIPTVEAAIGYLVDTGEMPVFYQSNVAGERTSFEGEREQRSMVIRDARALPNTFSLDVEGFELNVLQGLDLERYRPIFLLIEMWENKAAELAAFLEPHFEVVANLSHHDVLLRSRKA